ncbi:LruC domain-containing protein [Mucilaginibacter daejeonensis]|uniref:LruC domain-containing protein n=1 Tax=Mucilaginibacter daejeonensis TaxID=398049 RepID=UPI001D17769B|nr:LruC domain-containing protein [Mucilaginibacter daejeonensis]UEG53328.1 LruC domain-containing protein [Mucilaginibacter daejeonensis]
MKRKLTPLLLAGVVAFSACKKDNNSSGGEVPTAANKIAPDGFNFNTTKNVTLNLSLKTNNDQPLAGIVVSVALPTGDAIFKGVTNSSGVLQGTVTVPTSATKLIIDPAYVGVIRNAEANISSSNTVNVTLGGKDGYSGDVVAAAINSSASGSGSSKQTQGLLATDYAYPGSYTASTAFVNTTTYPRNLGRPVYLEATPDVVDASLLSYINASLPEGSKVQNTHPEYLASTATSTINVTKASDVYVTFVSEGAGYQSTLAYYTYKTGFPPVFTATGTLLGGIDKITYVFPNASAYGSGGGLKAGDKVKLGNFEAGTSIAFVLMQNAWTGSGVSTSAQKFSSDAGFNPESTASLRKHTVTLYDDVHKLFITGFEDCNRQNASANVNGYTSDEDFNDLVFYTTSSVASAISEDGVPVVDKGGDTDGDGVQDEQDAFPNDATRAYISYYPSASTYANIAFEDNWPKKGDYDLNDLVVSYRYTFTSNASNQVVDMKGDYTVAASGASFHNGFGVQLPVAASAVKSVTGQKQISNYISFASNGVEAGQTKAVIVPFDNHEALIKNPDGAYFINVLSTKDKVTSTTASVMVTFNSPIAASTLQPSAFNPFLISNLRRGYEIHLPGFAPTDKVDTKLFGTDDDASVSTSGKYYISSENWPWAIGFQGTYNYPFELQPVNEAYLHFGEWASSGGTTFTDWYSNTASGYRNTSKIYNK